MSRFLFAVSLAALVAGCAVGPDFERPAKPTVPGFDSKALPAATDRAEGVAGAQQTFKTDQPIPAEWWQLFHSEPLNRLVEHALEANPDIAAAEAALRVADENEQAASGYLFPTIGGSFSSTREKLSSASFGGGFPSTIFTLHDASVSVSYGLDLFGGTRREIEEYEAQKEYQAFELEAARLSLTANVVTAAIQEASLRGQLDATEKIIDEETHQVDLLQRQLDVGAISKEALLQQQATVAQFKATVPPLEKQLAFTRHQLSVLGGDFPSDEPTAEFRLQSIMLPEALPVSLPSEFVDQRPDIRAAEANLHSASAAIGVSIANRLPQITLSADMGSVATTLSKLFTPGSGLWSFGFTGSQTFFDAGTLAHEQGAAEAQYDMAAAQYKKTVLTAFQNVADTLRALQSDAAALKAQTAAEHAASESLKLAQSQFSSGSISYLALLDAERTEQQAVVLLVQAQALRYADTAALFEALGGGWWNRPLPTPADPSESQASQNTPEPADLKHHGIFPIQLWREP